MVVGIVFNYFLDLFYLFFFVMMIVGVGVYDIWMIFGLGVYEVLMIVGFALL